MFDLSSELRRKAFHLIGSLIPIVYYFLDRETALIGLSIINAVLLLIEWLRLNGKIELPKVLLRPHENKQVAAYIYFQTAALISILVFDKTIAIAALLMLAVGDTASGLAGSMIRGGNIRNHDTKKIAIKPLPIMAAMFVACLMTGLVLLSLPLAKDMAYLSLPVYAAGAAGATLGDAIPLRIHGRPVDDNLMIPLLSGVFMSVVRVI
jgi:dolichol kinase